MNNTPLVSKSPPFRFVLLILACLVSQVSAFSQTLVNRVWTNQFGAVSDVDWSVAIGDDQGNTFTLGHTVVSADQIDVLLTKQNTFGQILWEKQFGTPNQKNYGVSLTFDNNDNIYVIAASQSNTDQFYNYLIIKYDPNANELWHQYHDGDGGDDIPTDLSYESTEGKLYVTGTSVQTNNEYDYLTLKVNPANGNIEWERTYEFAQLNDIAASIVTYGSGRIVVTGGSADSPTDWDIATVMYNGSGVEIHVNRIKNPTPGFDQPTGIVKDINGDFFITGNRSNTSGDYDIYTVKFDEALDIIWEKYFDGAGKEDNAYDIKIDTSGNLYVCGTTEKSNNGKDFLLIKYDNNGDQLWTQRRRADNHLNAAIAKKIALEPNGDVVVAGEIYQGLSTQTLVVKYDEQGKKLWETKPNTSDSFVADRYVTGVHTNDGNIYVGSITDGGANDRTYETSQLETYDRNLTFEYDTEGNPTQAAGEVIIRFHPDIVNTNFVDDASVSYGTISEIINDPTLINSMSSALNGGKDFSNWKMLKIFHGLNTSITTTTTRTGEVIPIPRLWSAMVLKLENGMSVSNAVNNLEAISSGILYAHPNTAFSGDTPNDPEYGLQQSIKSTDGDADINVEPAWDLIENSTSPWDKTIRVGILDSGVEYGHEDFVCPNTICQGIAVNATESSIFYESLDFIDSDGAPHPSIDVFGHGTKTSGIIGALRNNNKGIAGIAGGNITNNLSGVQLYSYRVLNEANSSGQDIIVSAWMDILNPPNPPKVDILNHSLGSELLPSGCFDETLRVTYELLYKAGIIVVNSRGNNANTETHYPATMRDDWSISVGSSGTDGKYLQQGSAGVPPNTQNFPPNVFENANSSYGQEMDFIAPGTNGLILTTVPESIPINKKCYDPVPELYNCYNGASAATPHVSGIAALILEHSENDNLSIEDIEHIIEFTATDITSPNILIMPPYIEGFDEKNGWGRVNAEKALKLTDVNHDNLRIVHVDVHGSDVIFPFGCEDIIDPFTTECELYSVIFENAFENPVTGTTVSAGVNFGYETFMKTHRANFELNLCDFGGSSATSLVTFSDANKEPIWVRNSDPQVSLWGEAEIVFDGSTYLQIIPEDDIKLGITQITNDAGGFQIIEGTLTGYSYNLYEDSLSIPYDEFPQFSTDNIDIFSFSILLENADNVDEDIDLDYIPDISTVVSEYDKDQFKLELFPNPTLGQLNLSYQLKEKANLQILITDTNGSTIHTEEFLNVSSGNHIRSLQVRDLQSGVYFCQIKSAFAITCVKFIKI